MTPSPRIALVVVLAVLVGGVLLVGGFGWGVQTVRARWWPYPVLDALRRPSLAPPPEARGRWRLLDGRRPWIRQDPRAFTAEQLEALGYAEGTLPAPDRSGAGRVPSA